MTKRNLGSLVAILVFGGLIFGYLLRNVKLKVLVSDFDTINWWWIWVAFGCIILYLGLEGVVTKLLMSGQPGFSFKDAFRIPLIEQLFNGITPFSSGGQPAQLLAMLQSGVDGGKASSVLLMKFVVFQSMIVITFLISLVIGFHYVVSKMSYLTILIVLGFLIHLAVIVALLLVMYWYSLTQKLVQLLAKPVGWFMKPARFKKLVAKLDLKIDTFHRESLRIIHQGRLMVKLFVITFFQLAFYYLIPYFIMLGLSYYHVNALMVVVLHVLIFMIISLFPIPGGSGGAEYSFSVLFKSYVRNSGKLILMMIIWRLLTYYLGLFLGLIALFIKPNRTRVNENA